MLDPTRTCAGQSGLGQRQMTWLSVAMAASEVSAADGSTPVIRVSWEPHSGQMVGNADSCSLPLPLVLTTMTSRATSPATAWLGFFTVQERKLWICLLHRRHPMLFGDDRWCSEFSTRKNS